MRFEHLARAFGQAIGEALAENGKFRFDSFRFDGEDAEDWQTLEEIRLTVAAPTVLKVALGRHDIVRVREDDKLSIEVEGGPEAESALRFLVSEDSVKIARRRDAKADKLVIDIAMPAPGGISIGGAGRVEAVALAADATLKIGGSGHIAVENVAATRLTAKIGGSGTIVAKGSAEELKLKIGGSGHFLSPELSVERAHISIGGSGRAEVACEGEVEARIGGSGDIVINGTPKVSLHAGGSGRLRCEPSAD
jgi:hypothetical protein